jgi:predicted ATPase/class 3 adenylate cyclase/DNA-binding winged helix-turn-helix (wHTH) protein
MPGKHWEYSPEVVMLYRFDDYTLDTQLYELRRAGTPCPLEPQVFAVLCYLLQHRDRVVTRQELLEHVWPARFISETTLDHRVMQARQAIGDSGHRQRRIHTLRGRGYRFVGAVEEHTAARQTLEAQPADAAAIPAAGSSRLCPGCQHVNPAAAHFCNACATPLVVRCRTCGQENPPAATFCHTCTAPLIGPSPPDLELGSALPPPARLTSSAERRQLTVMFCDLVESTTLASQLDPEEWREIVRAYQAACAEVVHRFDGYIAQYLGDGLLVYFGYPQAHEDDAQRAVRAGLGLLAALDTLNARLRQETTLALAIRIGIHTGLVVVGAIGDDARQESLALGAVPNLASRLQGLAQPGTAVISTATYRLVQGFFACEACGEHQFTGVGQPLGVYRVVQESGAQSRFDVMATRGLTPLVGRAAEVAMLCDRWGHLKDGRGHVMVLSGEAGIGKSRLVHVLKAYVAREAHTLLECRASPYYQRTALYPMRDLLERTWQIRRDATAAAHLAKLEQIVRQYRLSVAETVPVLADFLSLSLPVDCYPPVPLTPQRQRRKTLETLVAIVLELAARQAVLFIFEDLHWADPSTVELLDLVIGQTPTVPLCLVLTCRPTFRVPWGSRSYLTQVTLDRLPRHHVEHMVMQAAGGRPLPADVVQQIVAQTDGVPLFVEELTRAVIESEQLQEVEGQYAFTKSLAALAIPATLQDSLMARLDRLATAKGVAQQGAVIGRQFSYALLHTISHLDATTLQQELARLVEAELLYQQGLPPHATYIFKHALIRDAAYASLLKRTRQQVHARIAQVLATQFPETVATQAELLAQHYMEAGLYAQAVGYWHRAGDYAAQRSANQEAIAHFRTALACLGLLPDTPAHARHALTLHVALAERLEITMGQGTPDVARAYTRAFELCQQLENPPLLNRVVIGLFVVSLARGELQQARELGEGFLSRAQRQYDPFLLLMAHRMLGRLLFLTGEFAPARGHFAYGLALYDLRLHPQQQHYDLMFHDAGMLCRTHAASVLWMQGYPAQALVQLQEGLALVQEVSRPSYLVRVLLETARLHQYRHEVALVRERVEAAIALACEQGFAHMLAEGTILRGWTLAMQGQRKESIAQMRQGLAAYRATGIEEFVPYFLALLAEAHGHLGEPAAGLSAVAEALALVEQHAERHHAAELHRLKGELLLSLSPNHHPQAEACFHRALDVARHQCARSLELRTAISLSRLWQRQGRRRAARQQLAPLYGWFTEGFDTADLQEAKALLEACEA